MAVDGGYVMRGGGGGSTYEYLEEECVCVHVWGYCVGMCGEGGRLSESCFVSIG